MCSFPPEVSQYTNEVLRAGRAMICVVGYAPHHYLKDSSSR